jgi:hypothetical protein
VPFATWKVAPSKRYGSARNGRDDPAEIRNRQKLHRLIRPHEEMEAAFAKAEARPHQHLQEGCRLNDGRGDGQHPHMRFDARRQFQWFCYEKKQNTAIFYIM